jgi:hypothetical protein
MMNTIPSLQWLLSGLLVMLLLGSQRAAGQTPGTAKADSVAKAKPVAKVKNKAPDPVAACPDCLPDTPVTCDTALKTVTLDFNCRCFDKDAISTLNGLKQGDTYRLRIVNINLLLYKVALGVRDTTIATALPFPTLASGSLSDLTGLTAGLTALSTTAKAPVKVGGQEAFVLAKKAKPLTDKQKAKQQLDAYAKKLQGNVNKLTALNEKLNAALLLYSKKLTNSYLEYRYLNSLPATERASVADINAAATELAAIRTELNTLRGEAAADNQAYLDNTAKFQKVIADDTDLKKEDDAAKATYKQFTEDLTKIEASIAADNVQKLLKSLTDAVNNSCLQYVSLPQQFTQQNAKLRINITPRSPDYSVPEYHTQLVFPIDRQFFWGISSGLFVSRLYSAAYSAKPNTSGTSYTLVEENPGRFEFGPSAMLRGGYVLSKGPVPLGLQLGFGPALSVGTKVRPRLLAGGGFSFGDLHKVLLDGGVAIGYVDRLSAAYDLTTGYTTAPDNAVVSVLRANFYVGLHYLFTK